jgi:hypothetical protein
MTIPGVVKVWNASSGINLEGGVLAAGSLDIAAGPASMLTFNGGTWRHTGGNWGVAHDFTISAGGATIDVQGNATLTLTGNAVGTGDGHFTKTGTGRLLVNGSLAAASGVTNKQGVLGIAGAGQTLRSLRVEAGRTFINDPVKVGDNTSTTPLQVAGGQMDITNDGMVVDFSPALHPLDAQAMTRAQINAGYNSGAWNGQGIISTPAASDVKRAVGYALASDIPGAVGGNFLGIGGIDASSMLLRFTVSGDTNLDGVVDFPDLLAVSANFGKTNQFWVNGDTNYDGTVDFPDLLAVSANFGIMLPAAIPGASDEFNEALAQIAARSVPEPGMGMMLAVVGVMLGRRRRSFDAKPPHG